MKLKRLDEVLSYLVLRLTRSSGMEREMCEKIGMGEKV